MIITLYYIGFFNFLKNVNSLNREYVQSKEEKPIRLEKKQEEKDILNYNKNFKEKSIKNNKSIFSRFIENLSDSESDKDNRKLNKFNKKLDNVLKNKKDLKKIKKPKRNRGKSILNKMFSGLADN